MFVNRQPIRNAVIDQKIIFYNELKRIDFIIDLLNYDGVLYREYRMALPLKMTGGEICYEVPFGKVTVGKDEIEGAAGERYDTPCEEIHPRGIQNWIGADNDSYGVILSSSVAVADYIDPTDNTAENHILQPLLIASRRSCHGEGNEYLQTGDHHFGFSFTSYPKGGDKGRRFGVEANEKLIAVTGAGQYADAALPEEMSFFSIDDEADNLIISTVKKAEDEPAVIIRIYDTAGRGSDVTLKSFRRFGTAVRTNLIEETLEPLPVNEDGIRLGIGKYSIETLLIR
jgi:alpha-mannosidase